MPVSEIADSVAAWPEALAERVRVLRGGGPESKAGYVLYWMRVAARGHENPALDAALALGAELDRPVFVYHALDERYPFASDRHHRFILEGARDAAAELAARGIGHAFHLARPGHRGPHLASLWEGAAAVVSEDAPIGFLAEWTEALARRYPVPVLAVDSSCVVPLARVSKAHDRAFAFRRATAKLRRERLERAWPDRLPVHACFVPELPFQPVDLASADVEGLIARCEIDHGVAPVPGSPGGSRAGYARWDRFKREGLPRYPRDRNDPLRDATSRLSPYLHYGHVSPFRIVREAAAEAGPGAEKFLDELLVWRELAWHFCHHRRDHASPAALPGWARETLAEHESDPRQALYSWETLARGRTGDPLWDAAQRALLVHGELHNNLRMTWGKAFLGWTRDAGHALRQMEDLNHRYALDGRDPSSWGGLLWCLGQFDRPFPPPRPILGSVRPRETAAHARRLDPKRYVAHVGRAALDPALRVAVIGAGIAGLACARTLTDHGLEVVVHEKSRGPGGRTSTRRGEAGRFDHGAQYFTARDPDFVRFVASWLHDGLVEPWNGRIVRLRDGTAVEAPSDSPRYVPVPRMSALARHLASDLELRCGLRVAEVARADSGFRLRDEAGGEVGHFDAVLVAVPAPQAIPLLAAAPQLAALAASAQLAPCLAAMAGFASELELPFDAAFVEDSPLAWVARDSSKPGRESGCRWVLHASPSWSDAHLEDDPGAFAEALTEAFAGAVGRPLLAPVHVAGQRWRYARATKPLAERCLFETTLRLGACGDWCGGDRVEGAWRSGVALAGRLLGAEAQRLAGRRARGQRNLFEEVS